MLLQEAQEVLVFSLMDFTIFTTPEAWISLLTLTFLEIVLGIDNIVFISITCERLPENKRHIGRKLGLAGALVMRCLFLCFASWLVHLSFTLFTINLGPYSHNLSFRDLVMLVGGAYLIFKGISELKSMFDETELSTDEDKQSDTKSATIGLPRAVGTIMVMDIVFSIDSVITAVGLAEHLVVMVLAVIIAVVLMMVFIDPISDFINKNAEMKILALLFIAVIGGLLVFDSLGITSGVEVLDMHLEKFVVYCSMVFAVVLELIQMRYKSKSA